MKKVYSSADHVFSTSSKSAFHNLEKYSRHIKHELLYPLPVPSQPKRDNWRQ